MAATQASASVAPAEDDDQPVDVIVQIDELVKSYAGGSRVKGAVHAVKGVSFDVREGELFTICATRSGRLQHVLSLFQVGFEPPRGLRRGR